MVRRLILLLVILLAALPTGCAEMEIGGRTFLEIAEDAANNTWNVYVGRLIDEPYDPGTFAWGLSHALRTFVKLYRMTSNRIWVDRAVAWIGHLEKHSDVNGDGEPSWGNYNESMGTDRYEFAEHTVHDGVICIPILELVDLVFSEAGLSSDPALRSKAEDYLYLVRAVVDYHAPYWTDVTNDSGYYWRTTETDDMIIINQFTALGSAEMMLADLLGNNSYLERPEKMARLVKGHLEYDEGDDCYIWLYSVGGRMEDISHGGIDLEFMIQSYQHGLVFDDTDMRRLVATYQKRVWRGIEMFRTGSGISAYVDGGLSDQDYARLSKTWPYLCLFEPRILEQHRVALEVMAETSIRRDRVMARIAAEMAELENLLRDAGVNTSSMLAFEPAMIWPELERLNESINLAEGDGADVLGLRSYLGQLYSNLEEEIERDVSGLVRGIWEAIDSSKVARASACIASAEAAIQEAQKLGLDTSRHALYLGKAKESFDEGLYDSAVAMCQYPLRLWDEIPDAIPLALLLPFLWLGRLINPSRTARR